MGACGSTVKTYPHDLWTSDEAKASNNIEEQLLKDKADEKRAIKILLLGASDSGKSTIMKQMKILHLNGFTKGELQTFAPGVRNNTLLAMQTLCKAATTMEIPLDNPRNREVARQLCELPLTNIPLDIREDMMMLWGDAGVKAAFRRRNEFSLFDSAQYFLENIDRTFRVGYVPQEPDVLRIRTPTTGVTQTDFVMDKILFKMFDVGGQRGERKKWIHYFDDVTAILYISAMSEYDQVLLDDRSRNKLNESLELFSGIINLPWFKKAHVILFLNKNDIFAEKIKNIDLGIYFPSYTGGCNYEAALKFIQDEYFDRVEDPAKNVYCHVTCATSTDNIKFVWKSTKHMILEAQLTGSGLKLM